MPFLWVADVFDILDLVSGFGSEFINHGREKPFRVPRLKSHVSFWRSLFSSEAWKPQMANQRPNCTLPPPEAHLGPHVDDGVGGDHGVVPIREPPPPQPLLLPRREGGGRRGPNGWRNATDITHATHDRYKRILGARDTMVSVGASAIGSLWTWRPVDRDFSLDSRSNGCQA